MDEPSVFEVAGRAQHQAAEAAPEGGGVAHGIGIRYHGRKCGARRGGRQWGAGNLDAILMSRAPTFRRTMMTARIAYLRAVATVGFTAGICLLARPLLQTTDVAMLLLL